MMKKEKRECAVCGKKFTPKTANSKYCSEKCYKKQKAILDKNRKAKAKVNEPLVKSKKKAVKIESKEVVNLPKKPAVKVEVIKIKKSKAKEVLIHRGDNVRFVDFPAERILKFGMKLVKMALESMHEIEEKKSCECKDSKKKSCKCAKKTEKKSVKK